MLLCVTTDVFFWVLIDANFGLALFTMSVYSTINYIPKIYQIETETGCLSLNLSYDIWNSFNTNQCWITFDIKHRGKSVPSLLTTSSSSSQIFYSTFFFSAQQKYGSLVSFAVDRQASFLFSGFKSAAWQRQTFFFNQKMYYINVWMFWLVDRIVYTSVVRD